MKRFILHWKFSIKSDVKCHLTKDKLKSLDEKIENVASRIPFEFARKLSGGITSAKFWKATEFRLFMLYVGPVVLRNILPDSHLQHFLLFSTAMRLLLTKNQSPNMRTCEGLLNKFIEQSKVLYGNSFISYNVHSLLHIPDDYLKFGPVDNVSCFKFENYLGCIKNRISGKNIPLEQLARHISFQNDQNVVNVLPSNHGKFFIANDFHFCPGVIGAKDNGVQLKNGEIGIVTEFNDGNISIDIY